MQWPWARLHQMVSQMSALERRLEKAEQYIQRHESLIANAERAIHRIDTTGTRKTEPMGVKNRRAKTTKSATTG